MRKLGHKETPRMCAHRGKACEDTEKVAICEPDTEIVAGERGRERERPQETPTLLTP